MSKSKKAGVKTLRSDSELRNALSISKVKGALYSLFHYTNTEALGKIVAGKGIRLSRMDRMNDGTERFNGADRTYAFCLSAVPTESAGMWIAYGVPRQDAIRVRFSGKLLHDLCEANDGRIEVFPVIGDHAQKKSVSGKISLQYVGYVSRSGDRVHVRNVIYQFSPPKKRSRTAVMDDYGSFIKFLGWEYEHEIRLVVRLDEAINAQKIELSLNDVVEKMLRYKPRHQKGSNGMPSVIVGPWGSRNDFMEKFKGMAHKLECNNREDVQYFLSHSRDELGLVRESEFKDKIHLGHCTTCGKNCNCDCVYYEGTTMEAKK